MIGTGILYVWLTSVFFLALRNICRGGIFKWNIIRLIINSPELIELYLLESAKVTKLSWNLNTVDWPGSGYRYRHPLSVVGLWFFLAIRNSSEMKGVYSLRILRKIFLLLTVYISFKKANVEVPFYGVSK